ncbi:hypothetical protein LPJ57_007734, partial [Coemansia sp. RSA 486]
ILLQAYPPAEVKQKFVKQKKKHNVRPGAAASAPTPADAATAVPAAIIDDAVNAVKAVEEKLGDARI